MAKHLVGTILLTIIENDFVDRVKYPEKDYLYHSMDGIHAGSFYSREMSLYTRLVYCTQTKLRHNDVIKQYFKL